MIQAGNWSGYYSFLDPEINKIRGFDKTKFDIEIITVKDNKFTGKVQDDLTTGGTEGIGEIIGQINGDKVEFVKKMPVMTLLIDRKGTRKTYNKKHRPIYYTGQLSSDKQTVTGTWRFKFGFVWLGIIPVPVRPSKGSWTMTFKY
jgi:hypothetical protein